MCDPVEAPPPVEATVPGVLAVAPGLAAADFDITVFSGDDAAAAGGDGAYSADVPLARAGLVFATPRAGTASAGRLAAGTGLYMTPALGRWRVTAAHVVAESGAAALDAQTTIVSLQLLHPMLAHPSADVQRRQAAWILGRAAAGWPAFADAARQWDADLAAGSDFAEDAALAEALRTILADVAAEMPEFTPDAAAENPWLAQARLARGIVAHSAVLARAGNAVSTLGNESADAAGVVVKAGTVTGTALDYYAAIWPAAEAAFPAFADSPAFLAPDALQALPHGSLLASSHVPASSYAS